MQVFLVMFVLTAIAVLARVMDSVSVDPSARTEWHRRCFELSELCTDGPSCPYARLRKECWFHKGRFRQFDQFERHNAILHLPELNEALAEGEIETLPCGHTESYHKRWGKDLGC